MKEKASLFFILEGKKTICRSSEHHVARGSLHAYLFCIWQKSQHWKGLITLCLSVHDHFLLNFNGLQHSLPTTTWPQIVCSCDLSSDISSLIPFFYAAGKYVEPWSVSTSDGLSCYIIIPFLEEEYCYLYCLSFCGFFINKYDGCSTLSFMYLYFCSVHCNYAVKAIENVSRIRLAGSWWLYIMFFTFAYSWPVGQDLRKSVPSLLIVGHQNILVNKPMVA